MTSPNDRGCSHTIQEYAENFGRIEEQIKTLKDSVNTIKAALLPNGRPGLILDVDRLKQRSEKSKWLFRATAIVVLGLVLSTLWTKINPPVYTAQLEHQTNQIKIK
jgi:hypothetical protein